MELRNFGRTSLVEVKQKLQGLGVSSGDDRRRRSARRPRPKRPLPPERL